MKRAKIDPSDSNTIDHTRATLVIRTRSGYRYEFPLSETPVTIGRGRDCDLVVDDGFTSRHHARLECERGRYTVLDQGSKNGVYVGGRRIKLRHVLSAGDEITIGETNLTFSQDLGDETVTRVWAPVQPAPQSSSVVVDARTWAVWVEGKKLADSLSVLEFKFLAYLFAHVGEVCSREDLGSELWGEGMYTNEMLHQLVHRLKRRIEPDPYNPRFVVSIPGAGYVLKTESEPASSNQS